MIHYNKTKNVLFAASRDGKFNVWKIPHEWRSKVIDDRELDAEYERRRKNQAALREKGRSNGTKQVAGLLSVFKGQK